VEWPERIQEVLPKNRLWIAMRYLAEEQRGMTFTSRGDHYDELLADFRKRVFGG
jgi:tRNA threonylcarbamoyladenosine biosynthesis protein TsaE